MEFQALPEGCIADILSRTSPVDVCRLSSVSKTFCSAADSDAVWTRFLPSDSHFSSIISQSPSLANAPSKKALYLALSDRPIIIDHGKQSFQLERKSGKKCYMLGARALAISWGEAPQYWNWTTMPDSRFPEIVKLVGVCWFDIRGKMNTLALSPNTLYAAFLVFKMIDAYGFDYRPVELSVCIFGGETNTKNACLDPELEDSELSELFHGLERPQVRSDGWLEIEMGEFFNSNQEDEMQSFQLERKSGKKWYMLGARALTIVWGDTALYWKWITMPDSRFPEVAELCSVCWLEIRGMINTQALSPNTQYAVFLVYKMIRANGFYNCAVELSVGDECGQHSSTKIVCLDPNWDVRPHNIGKGSSHPSVRSDGWLEIEMGEFFNSGTEDEQMQMSVIEIKEGFWKSGMFLEGIEVRPKEDN